MTRAHDTFNICMHGARRAQHTAHTCADARLASRMCRLYLTFGVPSSRSRVVQHLVAACATLANGPPCRVGDVLTSLQAVPPQPTTAVKKVGHDRPGILASVVGEITEARELQTGGSATCSAPRANKSTAPCATRNSMLFVFFRSVNNSEKDKRSSTCSCIRLMK